MGGNLIVFVRFVFSFFLFFYFRRFGVFLSPPRLLGRSFWNFLRWCGYSWSNVSHLWLRDPCHGSGSRSIFVFLEKPSYLKDQWTDLQYLYIKWKLLIISTTFITNAKRFDHSYVIQFWVKDFSLCLPPPFRHACVSLFVICHALRMPRNFSFDFSGTSLSALSPRSSLIDLSFICHLNFLWLIVQDLLQAPNFLCVY